MFHHPCKFRPGLGLNPGERERENFICNWISIQAGCPSCRLTNSVKALKGKYHIPRTCALQGYLGGLPTMSLTIKGPLIGRSTCQFCQFYSNHYTWGPKLTRRDLECNHFTSIPTDSKAWSQDLDMAVHCANHYITSATEKNL